MRIAVVGAGTIGSAHALRLSKIDAVEEILIATRTSAKGESVAAATPKATATDLDTAFAAGVDGIVIAAITAAHAPLVHRALDAQTAVFTEKPIALDVGTTREVVEHANRCLDVPVQIGFQRRFDAGYQKARESYRSGELGFVHTVHATTYDQNPPPAAYVPTSGGLFKDCSIHDFDIIRWVTGQQAVSIFTQGSNMGESYFSDFDDVDSGASLVTYDNGMIAFVGASRNNGAGHDVRLELFGSKGQRFVGLDDRTPLVTAQPPETLSWQQNDPYHLYLERFDAAFDRELATFVDVCAGNAESPCTPAEALEALCISEAAGISRQEGRVVHLSELAG